MMNIVLGRKDEERNFWRHMRKPILNLSKKKNRSFVWHLSFFVKGSTSLGGCLMCL